MRPLEVEIVFFFLRSGWLPLRSMIGWAKVCCLESEELFEFLPRLSMRLFGCTSVRDFPTPPDPCEETYDLYLSIT